ncbi:hypothetical protein SAMN05660330_03699 [Desulforhopalus singaporensis]|uniref:Uncharacterized protein n=1 Tax=Desulforhopalus singaporensis TaxID=91360 RepID=A0A1H0US25_9BACT|nr:hypothetical protein SAMN05660330_03699 [Desulforhopalus singaporensis]
MKKTVLATMLLMVSVQWSPAATTKGEHPACVSEEALDEFTQPIVSNNEESSNYILSRTCIITRSGLKISVLKRSWTISKIMVYLRDWAPVMWTSNENIQE